MYTPSPLILNFPKSHWPIFYGWCIENSIPFLFLLSLFHTRIVSNFLLVYGTTVYRATGGGTFASKFSSLRWLLFYFRFWAWSIWFFLTAKWDEFCGSLISSFYVTQPLMLLFCVSLNLHMFAQFTTCRCKAIN